MATPPHSWLKVNTIPYFGVGVGLGPGQEPQLGTVPIMCCPLQMESRRLVSVLCLVLAPAPATAASPADAQLRLEIAEAASDSRLLADELADMLARLEADQSRQQAVEAAVRGKSFLT